MTNNLFLILLFLLIHCIVLTKSNDNNSTYLRRNLVSADVKLCSCDKVVCGLCMTGCSPSTSSDCNRRNWCYCNIMGTDCLEV